MKTNKKLTLLGTGLALLVATAIPALAADTGAVTGSVTINLPAAPSPASPPAQAPSRSAM